MTARKSVFIHCDEYFPYYDVETAIESVGVPVPVHPHKVTYWKKVLREFNKVQEEMEEYYNEAKALHTCSKCGQSLYDHLGTTCKKGA